MRLCPSCKKRPKQKHFNSKWCLPCALELRKRPRGRLTPKQERLVRKYAGTMFIKKLAKKVGTSDSNLDRWGRDHGVNLNALKYPESVIKAVTNFYSKHGRLETEKRFPEIRVRSIIERYPGPKPRQIRWKESEIILAAKMAGLVDGKRQARIFNRPGANEGSIKSLWMKRFKIGGGNVHGMSEWMAKHLLKPGYPVLKTRVWAKRKGQRCRGPVRGIVLWCEMEPFLLRGLPKDFRDAVKTLSKFQRWLFETDDPASAIRQMTKMTCVPGKRLLNLTKESS